jgi:hypothetical protein
MEQDAIPGLGETKEQQRGGQVTLGHLLMAIAFFMPAAAAFAELKRAHGGIVRYVVGGAAAMALGALIVRLDWASGKQLWLHSQRYSERSQNWFAVGGFGLQIGWIIAGAIVGFRLISFVLKYVH